MSLAGKILEDWNTTVRKQGIILTWRLFWRSFLPKPENAYCFIQKDSLTEKSTIAGFDDFIKICDNRLAMSKSLLHDLSIILSAIFVSFTVIATILAVTAKEKSIDFPSMIFSQPVIAVLTIFLFICVLALLIWIGYLRTQIYTWASFKEFAIISQSEWRENSEGQR